METLLHRYDYWQDIRDVMKTRYSDSTHKVNSDFEAVGAIPTANAGDEEEVCVWGIATSQQYSPIKSKPWRTTKYCIARVDMADIRYTSLQKIKDAMSPGDLAKFKTEWKAIIVTIDISRL